jgi:hypothetical protein
MSHCRKGEIHVSSSFRNSYRIRFSLLSKFNLFFEIKEKAKENISTFLGEEMKKA